MKAFIVDTNVLNVANGKAEQAGPDCIIACVDALEMIQKEGLLVLDEGMEIFAEYQGQCSFSGQPGVGDAFFKWVHNNRYNDRSCERVALTPSNDPSRSYEEFPSADDLKDFDRSDRKFVAAALASAKKPTIQNAVDSDWWNFRAALKRARVRVFFLCPEQFED